MSEYIVYQDRNRSSLERTEDLLARMTVEEKIGQLYVLDGHQDVEWLREKQVGAIINVSGDEMVHLQREVGDRHRLRIPLVFSLDCIHGHAFYPGATIFPTPLALSSSWNSELLRQIGRITAVEMTCTGIHWTFSPSLDLARDLRWGRIGETFGEDPYLAGKLGAAMIRGYQGESLSEPTSVLACAKHFAGYCETIGGRDATETTLSERVLRRDLFPPFKDAIQAECATMMAGYQAVNGSPCSVNHWLLTIVLRDEMGFPGFVVSDWQNLERLIDTQFICTTREEAATLALQAGNDMAMGVNRFPDAALAAFQQGMLEERTIDDACRRILRMKFEVGLFDDKRYPNLQDIPLVVGCQHHRDVALDSAYESLVLLENKNEILPLKPDVQTIAVVGPNAHDLVTQSGDWSFGFWKQGDWEERLPELTERHVTVLDGIRERAGTHCQVLYQQGCGVLDSDDDHLEQAVEAAQQADVTIAVVGDNRYLTGEQRDRADLTLTGRQQAVLEAVHATGTPLIVILLSTKPLAIPWIAEHAAALIFACNPGMMTGTALAGLLFGDRNPCGKLTVSFPYHVGQQPVRYNQAPGWHGNGHYVDLPPQTKHSLYAFGYGKSYTTYRYSNVHLHSETLREGEEIQVSVDVENIGDMAGTEIVQLYIRDCVASVTRPSKRVKDFARAYLEPGESRTVTMTVPYHELAILDVRNRWVVEPGTFDIMVGSSSRDEDLTRLVHVNVE